MSKKVNNLVEIANILIEMKEERDMTGVPKTIMSRYPAGSKGIVINEDKYIVLNTNESEEVKESDKINTLKDPTIKYNANFYLSTHDSDEPDIIDEAHNKSKLINEAYTEVSFLPKDIVSDAEFDMDERRKARASIETIIDKAYLSPNDFDSYKIDAIDSGFAANVYDEIYRCRCVFTDISGNENIKSLLIKAYKVSNEKNAEYSYEVIDNDNIRELVENLENIVKDDKSKTMKSVYASVTNDEYDDIKSHIKEGIEHYYEENSKKFYRLVRVDIKAIYCLRLKKIPIILYLNTDGDNIIAEYYTFYSPVARDFNVFTCPNCGALSSPNYDGMKIHVDHDFSKTEDTEGYIEHPIGCDRCMERCPRCGAWHFKFSEYEKVLESNYLISNRKFLRNYIGKDIKTEDFCSCMENLTWIYDEMSKRIINNDDNNKECYSEIVDKFLTESCRMVFINYLTGEVVANNMDYMNYFYEYLLVNLRKQANKAQKDKEAMKKADSLYKKFIQDENISNIARIRNFVDTYVSNEDSDFQVLKLESLVKESLLDFKQDLAKAFNMPKNFIKITSNNKVQTCECCGSSYFAKVNAEGEAYYNEVKGQCACCAEATTNKLKMWTRADDGVTFFKPKFNSKKYKVNSKDEDQKGMRAQKIYQSSSGEVLYEDWLKNVIKSMIANISRK